MKLLVDTNVFLDFLLGRESADDVGEFLVLSKQHKDALLVSAMSLRDIGYILQKHTHDWKKTRDLQASIYSVVTKVVSTSADSAIESLYLDWEDYEDCLQSCTAEENGCLAIVTINKSDFDKASVPVFTPREIINLKYQ